MSRDHEEVRDPYEIALSIGWKGTQSATARSALSAYLEKLGCSAGAVLDSRHDSDGPPSYETVASHPANPTEVPALRAALERVRRGGCEFPVQFRTDEDGTERRIHLMELPSFGAIVLVKPDPPLPEDVFGAIEDLNAKLAETCKKEQREGRTGTTDEREFNQTLEELCGAAEEFLDSSAEAAVCASAVEAASEVLGFQFGDAYLYDREDRALVPASGASDEASAQKLDADSETGPWRVYRTGDPLVVADIETFDGELLTGNDSVRSGMILPLGDHGVLVTGSTEPTSVTESDRAFGRLLATMLRTALDRAGRERALHRINETTSSFVEADDADELSATLVERASEILELPITGVWEYEAREECLLPTAWTTKADELFAPLPTFGPGNSIAWEAFESGEPRQVDVVENNPNAYNPDSVLASELVVPIGNFGVITAGSTIPADFSQAEFEMLQALAFSAESALRLVERQRELELLDSVLARVLRHNVRNDLTVIRGKAELMAELSEKGIDAHADDIVRTSEDLLSTAEYAREIREVFDKRNETAVVDVARAIREAVATTREAFPEATIATTVETDRTLRLHPNIAYALRHAIENGIEHNDSESPVVEVRAVDVGDGVSIEITDDGPGISPSEVEPIRTRKENDLVHGSGVGLWILDRVVDYSGGTVHFETDGGGTTVVVSLGTDDGDPA